MDRYECLAKIGEGAAGVVHMARDRITGETVAVKRLRGGINGDWEEDLWLREARCLDACRGHPHLVELRAAHRERRSGCRYVVMEYVEGPSLGRVLREQRRGTAPFAEAEARRLMRQLLDGVAAMHAAGVMHRDIKPDNVVVGARGDLKICDFGMSRAVDSSDAAAGAYTSPVVTLWYRAPELILGSREYDEGVDTWALGCIMAELLAGAPLFPGRSEMDQLNRVFDTVGAGAVEDMRSWPEFARLPRVESTLCHRARPPSRLRGMFPGLSAAGLDVLTGLLACRPDKRLAAADALRCAWFTEADAADAVPGGCGGARRFTPCVSGVADVIIV